MKKLLSTILVVAIIITMGVGLFGSVALADATITTSIKVSPTSLPGAGTVNLTVTIKNNGDPITNVRLQYPNEGETVNLGDIGTGETVEHPNTDWAISEDMLDTDLAFKVLWTSADGNENSGTTQPVKIARQEAVVKVTGTATPDRNEVNAGDSVKFKFEMRNEGTVKIDNAYLTAAPIENGGQIGQNFSLEPGSKETKELSVTVATDMDVKPVFTYTANGEQQTLTLDTVSIRVKEAAQTVTMGVTLEADKTDIAAGDDVKFTVKVHNTGTSQLDGLAVTDFNNNTVNMSMSSVGPGATATGTATIKVAQGGSYSFNAVAVGSGGQSVNVQSNAVNITTDAEPAIDPNTLNVNDIMKTEIGFSSSSFSNAQELTMKEPGDVMIQAKVVNKSELELSNIELREETLGLIGQEATLAMGQETTFDKTFEVTETGTYVFKTSATLPDGTQIESEVRATIKIEPQEDSGMDPMMIGIIAVAVIVVVVILIIYFVRQRKKLKNTPGAPGSDPRAQGTAGTRSQTQAAPQRGQYGGPSPTGRPKPDRYNPRPAEKVDLPERPTTAQQEQYLRNRASKVETVDPSTIKPPQPPAPKDAGDVKFKDRNKL